jgi:hypothetical protein
MLEFTQERVKFRVHIRYRLNMKYDAMQSKTA